MAGHRSEGENWEKAGGLPKHSPMTLAYFEEGLKADPWLHRVKV